MRDSDDAPSLDLLRCFAVLHRERHLSRAAIRVGLSQPAMSRALAQLRVAFDDELFVRTPRGMLPTTRADALAPRILAVLDAASGLVRPSELDTSSLSRTFVLATSGFFDGELLPRLHARVARAAPGVTITTRPLADDRAEALESGRIDLMIGVSETVPAGSRMTRLYEERFVCAVRKKHPNVGAKLTLAAFLASPHLLVAPSGSPGSIVDSALASRGLSRRVALRVHAFGPAPAIVAASDLLLTAPSRLVEPVARSLGLSLFPPPLALAPFPVVMAWHPRVHEDPAHSWLRAEIVQASKRDR